MACATVVGAGGRRVRGVGSLPAAVAGLSGNSTASLASAGFAVRWLPHDVLSGHFTLSVARCALTRCELPRAAASRGTASVQARSAGGGLEVTGVANFPSPHPDAALCVTSAFARDFSPNLPPIVVGLSVARCRTVVADALKRVRSVGVACVISAGDKRICSGDSAAIISASDKRV